MVTLSLTETAGFDFSFTVRCRAGKLSDCLLFQVDGVDDVPVYLQYKPCVQHVCSFLPSQRRASRYVQHAQICPLHGTNFVPPARTALLTKILKFLELF